MGSRNGGIRNLSMKKFGTPIGAGPGRASEKVGLAGVGTPSVASAGALALALRTVPEESCSTVLPAPSTSGRALRLALPDCFWGFCCCWLWDWPWSAGCGASGVACAGCWSGWVWTWTCAGGVLGCEGAVTSWTLTIPPLTPGILIWSTGVPGGTSTVTVTFWPVASVTTSVRWSADAGITTAPTPTETAATARAPVRSLRLVDLIRNVLFPPRALGNPCDPRACERTNGRPPGGRTVPTCLDYCNDQPSRKPRLQAVMRAMLTRLTFDSSLRLMSDDPVRLRSGA